jgi:hypothetical protein
MSRKEISGGMYNVLAISDGDTEIIMGYNDVIGQAPIRYNFMHCILPLCLVQGYRVRVVPVKGSQRIFGFVFLGHIVSGIALYHIGITNVYQKSIFFGFQLFYELNGPLKAHVVGPIMPWLIKPERLYNEIVRINQFRRNIREVNKIGGIYKSDIHPVLILELNHESHRSPCKGPVLGLEGKNVKFLMTDPFAWLDFMRFHDLHVL